MRLIVLVVLIGRVAVAGPDREPTPDAQPAGLEPADDPPVVEPTRSTNTEPVVAEPTTVVTEPAQHLCRDARDLYVEPSLLVGSYLPALSSAPPSQDLRIMHRFSVGLLFHGCEPTRFRLGGTVFGEESFPPHFVDGFGLEAEADRPISPGYRLGLRVGVEIPLLVGHPVLESRLFTFGAGLHIHDVASLELDVFRLDGEAGLMAGVRAEGRAGKYIGGAEGIAVGVLGVVLIVAAVVYLARGGPVY